MAKTTKKKNKTSKLGEFRKQFRELRDNPSIRSATGLAIMAFSLFMVLALISSMHTWTSDYSAFEGSWTSILTDPDHQLTNGLGNLGALFAYVLSVRSLGIASLLPVLWVGAWGFHLAWRSQLKIWRWLRESLFISLIATWGLAILPWDLADAWVGDIGRTMALWTSLWLGSIGAWIVWIAITGMHVIWVFRLDPTSWRLKRSARSEATAEGAEAISPEVDEPIDLDVEDASPEEVVEAEIEAPVALDTSAPEPMPTPDPTTTLGPVEMTVETLEEVDEVEISNEPPSAIPGSAAFDPRKDLSRYQVPKFDLLKAYDSGNVKLDSDELEANKNRILETLGHYNIGIESIKAAVGPTVTLYEIVPEKGIRISKIKNLEDDIALSLSALGIRIIAPIPGRGTVGIEVPNRNPQIVSMRSVLESDRFQKSDMALPVAIGKTIANEVFVADLAKMPHLLMAGATGQGKSVGLNAILASILYSKHPAEVKFVLVDPKKVELTLYNKIERHFLAKLPDSSEAIITDTTKVIHTLNSLCIEMDQRYDLLKDAMVRNIKEYNAKFTARKLNPNDGHRYLPYIVLVIDEFADLIMTAGKEVETPIARLAQLARAIGIHLIVATQRPSVNVITGIIKANFPARVAFKVSSKIDSRTILDAGGAEQLIGKGDMLYSAGNDLIRLQCAFVDTPEVEEVCDFIGSQQAYPDAYHLPEYTGEDGSASEGGQYTADERDALFMEAAKIVVQHQQGSASLLQRKLKLGYNRAGRIVDQLEDAGILGPFEGSKARQVLVPDEASLMALING